MTKNAKWAAAMISGSTIRVKGEPHSATALIQIEASQIHHSKIALFAAKAPALAECLREFEDASQSGSLEKIQAAGKKARALLAEIEK